MPFRTADLLFNQDFFKEGNRRLYGIWRGEVEYNIDPLGIGRVKVRIPFLHGDNTATPTEYLPWCPQCEIGGGPDCGSVNVPIVGATVWVMFEQGDANSPVVLGTWRKIPNTTRDYNVINGAPPTNVPISMGKWTSDPGNETPQEAQDNKDPQLRIIFKSPKGTTIYANDQDGSEKLRIIDRMGQTIEMYCPVKAESNIGNAQQRGTRNAADGTQLPIEQAEGEEAYIKLIDAQGQYAILQAKKDSEKIIFHGKSGSEFILDSTQGEENIQMVDSNGNFIRIDTTVNKLTEYILGDCERIVAGNVVEQVEGMWARS